MTARTAIWGTYGSEIQRAPQAALIGYLTQVPGDRWPSCEDFRKDPAFDPNPFGLSLPEDACETALLVHSLATWGAQVSLRAAVSCASLQLEHQEACPAEFVSYRDAAQHAAVSVLGSASRGSRAEAKRAAAECARLYEPYESRPETTAAARVWRNLGAPWFAAQTAASDMAPLPDEIEPPPANPTWCRRMSVWPIRAADVVAQHFATHAEVRQRIRDDLLSWARVT